MAQKKLETGVPVTLEEIHVDVILLDWRKSRKPVEGFLKARQFRDRIEQFLCREVSWDGIKADEVDEAEQANPFLHCFGTTNLTSDAHDMIGLRLFVCGGLGRDEGLGFVRDMEYGFGWPSDPSGFIEDSWRTADMLKTEIEKNFPGLDFGMELGIWIGKDGYQIRLDPIVFRPLKGRKS